MIALHDDDAQLCSDLQHRLDYLRDRVREIWGGSTALPHFTKHGYDHCIRIEEHLAKMLPLLRHPLNVSEQYILLSGVWTHDIGMQDSRFSLGDKAITAFIDHEQDYTVIRDNHAAASQAWIMDVYNEKRERPELGLKPDGYAVPIATLARAHTNYDLAHVVEKQYVEGKPVRLRLLAILLVIADELDLDCRRVDLDTLQRVNIPDDSKIHWWCHHYIDGVSIVDHTPHVYMTLPSSYHGLLAQQWMMQAAAGLRKQLAKRVVRATLDEEGCWLLPPEIEVTFEDMPSKRPWPHIPLDTRAAIQEADIQQLQGYGPSDLLSFFGVDLYGVPVNDLDADEFDAFGEAFLNLVEAWGKMTRMHLAFLARRLRDDVQTVLRDAPFSPLTKHYLYVRAHTVLQGRLEARLLPSWGRPRSFPTDPTDDYLWEKMRLEYARPLLDTDDVYYRVRGMAATECARHADIIDEINRITERNSTDVVITAMLSNAFPTRLDDNGAYQALGPFVTQFNRDAGPLTRAATERMVQHHIVPFSELQPDSGLLDTGQQA